MQPIACCMYVCDGKLMMITTSIIILDWLASMDQQRCQDKRDIYKID